MAAVFHLVRLNFASGTRVRVVNGLQGQDHEGHVAADAAGNVYYLWVASDGLPYLAVSRDKGLTWGKPMMVGPPGVTGANLPSIAAGDEGNIAILYMGTTQDCCYAGPARDASTMWHGYVTVSTEALTDDPVFLTTTFNDPRDPLRRGSCGPTRCGGGSLDPNGVWDFLEIVIDGEGRPWASLVDTCTRACAAPGLSGENDDHEGFAGQLVHGPRLRGIGTLEPPAWALEERGS